MSGLAVGVFAHPVILPASAFNFCLINWTSIVTPCGENVSPRNYSHLMGRHQEQIASFPAGRLKVRAVSLRRPWPRDRHRRSERLRCHRHVALSCPLLRDWKTFVAMWNTPDLLAMSRKSGTIFIFLRLEAKSVTCWNTYPYFYAFINWSK